MKNENIYDEKNEMKPEPVYQLSPILDYLLFSKCYARYIIWKNDPLTIIEHGKADCDTVKEHLEKLNSKDHIALTMFKPLRVYKDARQSGNYFHATKLTTKEASEVISEAQTRFAKK